MEPDSSKGLDWRGGLLVLGGLLLWVLVFGTGIIVDSLPYRLTASPTNPALLRAAQERELMTVSPLEISAFKAWIVILVSYTPTNLAILCAVSGLVGTLGRRATLHHQSGLEPDLDLVNPYLSSLLRGFFVYLVLVSGALLLIEDPFANPSPQQYLRLAGFVSLLSFITNYNPTIFARLLGWIVERIEARSRTGAIRR